MTGRHLYVFQARTTGAIKVGKSNNPDRRLQQVQTGCPYTLRIILRMEDGGVLEAHVHTRLQKYRTRHVHGGEWFDELGLGEIPDEVWIHAQQWYLDDPDWWKK